MTPHQLKSLPFRKRFRLFVQWLGNQPEHARYTYTDVDNCAMAQFAADTLDLRGYNDFSAGDTQVFFLPNRGREVVVQLMPKTGSFFVRFALYASRFGLAYQLLAQEAGLPRRAWRRRLALRLLAPFVKHRHRLAA